MTVLIKPGWEWPGHRPGQYVRLGIEVDGIHHWRAYSLTSDPGRADGCITITPKLVPEGKVSPFLFGRVRPGRSCVWAASKAPSRCPSSCRERLLFISAGSGITPIMSMLRSISAPAAADGRRPPALRAHARDGHLRRASCARSRTLTAATACTSGSPASTGGSAPSTLDELCGDWRERETFLCGPAGLLERMSERWRRDGDPGRLHVEHFQPDERVGDGERGLGGTIHFKRSGVEACSDGEQPILAAGEGVGVTLPFGCRMGICHTCVGRLRAGQVRDLRTGRVHGQPGEMLQTCINAPEGAVEIDL